MEVLNFIVILIIIFLGLRLLMRFLFPLLLKLFIKRFQRKFFEQNPHLKNQRQPDRKEGEVHIEYNSAKDSKRKHNDDDGEYVDYEEIK